MSTTIDSKVVEMRFDNKHFENNVSTTMSTLDKLKQKLHLDGATKGLESVNSAAKKVDMAGLGTAVETVQSKFSAMQVVGVTALANITNSAVNAGKRMLESLTVAPVKDGFSEYEMTLNAVQTTMAGTGKTAAEVQAELKKLDEYADKTVYSTADMLNNLPKFTNAGVELEDATKAMIGIANATALAGGDAGKASIAFYNLGQAIGTGYLTRMDYNSINNAGIATMEWKEQMVEAAIAAGTLKKAGEDAYEAGGKTFTMQQLFIDGLQHQWATTDVMMTVFGKYGNALDKDVGEKAFSAAQDIKTFTQMMESLKATAGTGWKDTWQLIFGDLDQAKALWTGLSNFISGIITKMSDFRNGILEKVFDGRDSKWNFLTDKLDGAGLSMQKLSGISELLTGTSDTLNKSLEGTGTYTVKKGDYLYKIAREYGTTWKEIYKLNKDIIDDPDLIYPNQVLKMPEVFKEMAKGVSELTDEQLKNAGYTKDQIAAYRELEKAAKESGMTVDELLTELSKPRSGRDLLIDTFKNFGNAITGVAKAIGSAWESIFGKVDSDAIAAGIYNTIDALNRFSEKLKLVGDDGKLNENGQKIQRTFKGIFAAIDIVLTVVGGPLKIAFKILTQLLGAFDLNILDITAVIGDAIVKFRDWLDGVLDFTAAFEKLVDPVKSAIETFKKWIASLKESKNLPQDIAKGIASGFGKAVDAVKNFFNNIRSFFTNGFDSISESPIASFVEKLRSGLGVAKETIAILGDMIWQSIQKFLSRSEFAGISADSIAGLVQGFTDGASKVWNAAVEVITNLVQKVKDYLGIHSPSTVFIGIGGFIIAGLVKGIIEGLPDVDGAIGDVIETLKNIVSKIDLGSLFSSASLATLVAGLYNFSKMFSGLNSMFSGVGDTLSGVGEFIEKTAPGVNKVLKKSAKGIGKILNNTAKVVKSFSKVLNSIAFQTTMEGIKTLGITLLMLVGAIIVLTFFDTKELWHSVGIILALSVILGVLALAVGAISKASASFSLKDGMQLQGLTTGIIGIGVAVLLMAAAVKMIGSLDKDKAEQAFIGLGITIASMLLVLGLFALMGRNNSAENISKLAVTLLAMSALVLVMSRVIRTLGELTPAQYSQGLEALVWISGILAALVMVASLAGKNDLIGPAIAIGAIAGVVLAMAIVVKLLSELKAGAVKKGVQAILCFAGIIAALVAVLGLVSLLYGAEMTTIGYTILLISGAILAMAVVVKLLGELKAGAVKKGVQAILCFAGIIMAIIAVLSLISLYCKDIPKLGVMLLAISGAILVMTIVVKILGETDSGVIKKGTQAILCFAGIITALILVLSLVSLYSKELPAMGKTLLYVAGAIGILAAITVLLGLIPEGVLKKGLMVISVLSVLMMGLIAVTGLAKNCMGNIISITVAIAVIAAAVYILSTVDDSKLEGTTRAMVSLLTAFAVIIAVTGMAKKAMGTIIALTVAIAVIGSILYLLATLPVESTIGSAIALGGLMVVLTGILALMIPIGKKAKEAVFGMLALSSMAVPLALFGLVLAMMSALKVTDAMANVLALSVLCGAMTVLLYILAPISTVAMQAVTGMLALASMAVPLALFGLVLAMMSALKVTDAMSNVLALTVLCGALTLLLIPLTIIGALVTATGGVITAGVIALAAMAVPLALFVGVVALMSGIQNGIANAMALAMLMTVIGDVLFKISLVAPLAVVGVTALNAMIGLMTVIGVMATAIGALVTQFPQIQTFLDTGIPILEQLASGLGSIIGNFITGFAGEVMGILPQLAMCLSQFMMALIPFITISKMIDEQVLIGVGILTAAILAFTVAELIAGVASMAGLGLVALGAELSAFMMAALPFIAGAMLITPEMLSGVKTLADTILILTAANVLEGLTSWLTGGNSLATFAQQLPILGQGLAAFSQNLGAFTEDQLATVNCAAQAVKTLASAAAEIPNTGGLLASIVGENDLGTFASQFPILGTGLADFLTNVGTFTDEQVATVKCAAEAIKTLASASSEIPNTGGLLGMIVGENDLGTFASQFPVLGTGLAGFLTNVGTFTDEQVATVDCAAQAIKTLAQASSEIPNSGGWLGQIVGENDLETFASQFPSLGTGLADFLTNVGTFSEDQVATVGCAANAIKVLASAAESIPNSGGIWQKIVGENDLGDFASKFPSVGEGIKGFVDKLGEFSSSQVSTVEAGVKAINALSGLANTDLSGAKKNLSGFGDKIVEFAGDIASFCSSLPSTGDLDIAINNLNSLLVAVEDIGLANSGALATFANNLMKVGEEAVKKFVGAFTSESAKTNLKTAATTLASQAVSGAEDKESAMKTAGEDLGSGLVRGIEAKYVAAYNAGFILGQKAVQGEKDGQESNSPSKLTIKAGKWLGEGLVVGMQQMGDKVYGAGADLGKTATNTISSSISRVANAINTDIDAQPTIRPVLDLTDVKTGASALSSMLDMNSTVGVRANIGAISSMMNSRGQNGANDDVVSAIDKLRNDLGNIGGNTTYQVNGVTYDDGSNITDAVRTIVRAARIERRT